MNHQHDMNTERLRSVSPRQPAHHDNSCHDDHRPTQGCLIRSRSDETLSSFSVLPRRRTSLRRRRKPAPANTVHLIEDFNAGREVDLDKLTVGITESFDDCVRRSPGSFRSTGSGRGTSANDNVRSWLMRQNDLRLQPTQPPPLTGNDVRLASRWMAATPSQHDSVDVHHL